MEFYTYELLTPDECDGVCASIEDWHDPRTSDLKHNLEAPGSDLIRQRISSHEQLVRDTYAYKIYPPKFSKYELGDCYQRHADAPTMDIMNQGALVQVRTDYSLTLFLNDDFEGGEILGQTFPKGTAFVYPSEYIHEVTPITKGVRVCAVTWIQSRIQDRGDRSILRDLERELNGNIVLGGVHARLMRKWGEV